MESYNSFNVAQRQVLEAARILNLNEATRDLLSWPQREFRFTMPVKMDNGKVQIFHAFRIQYNTARGPAKGGIRYHPEETADIIRALACWMTWKTAALDLPLGGGKGGVVCDPRKLSDRELENVSRAYIRATAAYLGINKDVPAPDVYTNPQIMAWMMDEYETIMQRHSPGVLTDKPLQMGGSEGRRDATARGGVFTVREACKLYGIDPAGSFAIQGFGNAGQRAALLHQEILGGGKLIGACDSRGGVYNYDGLNVKEMVSYKLKKGTIADFPGGKQIPRDQVLELDADILYPAALENAITTENVSGIKARIICELANGPTSPEADVILNKRGTHVIPDVIASAGGVTVSYFEMVQDGTSYFWKEKVVHDLLDQKLTRAYHAMQETMKEKKVISRLAATIVGVARVAEACELRGWV